MGIQWGRIATAASLGTIAILLVVESGYWGLHYYRVWRSNGVWCMLGNDELGWIRAYGEENCPEVLWYPNQYSL